MPKISTLLRALACLFILCGIAPAQPVNALPPSPEPYLLKDINTSPSAGSNPQAFMQSTLGTFFFITNEHGGSELWKTDGTPAGTTRVKAGVGPGGFKDFHKWISPASWYADYNGILYFSGRDDNTTGLWRTDGTEGGTFNFLDQNGDSIPQPSHLTLFNGHLVFTTDEYLMSQPLYQTDGTQAGTINLGPAPNVRSNIIVFGDSLCYTYYDWSTDNYSLGCGTGSVSLEPNPNSQLFVFYGKLYFSARETAEPSHGWELWRKNEEGLTELVADINPTGDSFPAILGESEGWLVFSANDGVNGDRIFRLKGTTEELDATLDFNADASIDLNFTFLESLGGDLYFVVGGNTADDGLYVTGAGGEFISRIWDTADWDYLVWSGFKGMFYYTRYDPAYGLEVWRTGGPPYIYIFKDIAPGPRGSNPLAIARCGSNLCISADDGQHGTELWITNGISGETTYLAADLNLRPKGSNPRDFLTAENLTFFHTNDNISMENLWRTDGTPAGTIALNQDSAVTFVEDIPYTSRYIVPAGERVFFTAKTAATGRELWTSDGTPAGTHLVKDILPGADSSNVNNMTAAGEKLFFTANDGSHGNELWVSDGTQGGTHLVEDLITTVQTPTPYFSIIAPYGNRVIFTIYNPDLSQTDLWISDGTPAGTQYIRGFNFIQHPTAANGVIYFVARTTPVSGDTLYQTDGTLAGTQEIVGNPWDDYAHAVVNSGTYIYVIYSNNSGTSLWVMRGPGSNLERVEDFWNVGPHPPILRMTKGFNNRLVMLFLEYDESSTNHWVDRLYVSDGTLGGKILISDNFTDIEALQAKGDGFIFNAESGAEGRQIWTSDGTPEGTEQLTHFPQAMCSTHDMRMLGDAILLPLDDFEAGGTAGCELWTVMDGLWRKVYIPAVLK
jgi:ELWxxDGT repeat protein